MLISGLQSLLHIGGIFFTTRWAYVSKNKCFSGDTRGMLPPNVTVFMLGIKSFDLKNAHTVTLREGRGVGIMMD